MAKELRQSGKTAEVAQASVTGADTGEVHVNRDYFKQHACMYGTGVSPCG